MAAFDQKFTKGRRLEDTSSNVPLQTEGLDMSQYNYQGFCYPTQTSRELAVSSDKACMDPYPSSYQSIEWICFGMLVSLRAQGLKEHSNAQFSTVGSTLSVDNEGKLYFWDSTIPCGVLGGRDTKLLQLFCHEGIDFELRWIPETSLKGDVAEEKTAIWATIYGPRDIASDLRDTLQSLELFLQDPTYASKDTVYFNPQRFHNDPNARTVDFQFQDPPPTLVPAFQDEQVASANVLDSLTFENDLPETVDSSYLKTDLKSHQKQGLTFMIRREAGWRLHCQEQDVWSYAIDKHGHQTYINNVESCTDDQCPPNFRGGVLADPMGLGKTLSIIALIAYDKDTNKEQLVTTSDGETVGRGTLVVLPSSLLLHWEEELAKHLSTKDFTWYRYHGRHRVVDTNTVGFYHIILTTYDTVATEWKKHKNGQESTLFSHSWHRVVLDEGHEIKSLSTRKSQAACALTADCRWAVTGTPIQNRLSDLYSLFHFLHLSPYSDKKAFDKTFTSPWLRGDESGLQGLVKLLGYVMLRRPKTSIDLPRREDHRRYLSFSKEEQEAYDITKKKAVECLEDALISGRSQEGYRNALEKINALRVICELGYLPLGSIYLSPATCTLVSGQGIRRGPSEGSLTPNSIQDEIEEDGYETQERSKFEEIFPNLGDSSLSSRNLASCTSTVTTDQLPGLSLPATQWPTKINALIQDLEACTAHTKSVVFSYRTSILSVANTALTQAGIPCVQIDGTIGPKRRGQILQSFSDKPEFRVLLLSLGCGAVGAYLLEPQWNPAIEEQALARIHRLGQTQEVITIRFIMSGSIEEYILDIQDGKQDLISLLSYKSGGKISTKLQALTQLLR